MSRKVFTAGEVLAAADVNSFLMDQTVMSFAGTAARGSAIPTPTLGMYTHLEDAPARTEFWNGSAWVSPFGSTLLSTSTFTSVGSVIVDNIFTSQFRNYKIVFTVTTASAGSPLYLRFRAGGTPISANYNSTNAVMAASLDVKTRYNLNNAGEIIVCSQDMFEQKFGEITIHSPQLATRTFLSQFGGSGTACLSLGVGDQVDSTAYDGFVIFASGNMSGTFSVYGLRN